MVLLMKDDPYITSNKGYDNLKSAWFQTTLDEINSVGMFLTDVPDGNHQKIENMLYNTGGGSGLEIDKCFVYKIKKHRKRNQGDSSKLLVVYFNNADIILAKRYNNNQVFSLKIKVK